MTIGSFRNGSIAHTLFPPFWSWSGKFDQTENIQTKEEFLIALAVWEKKGQPGEERGRAALIVRDAFKRGTDYVNLSDLGLTALPPLPSVRMVDFSNNALEKWPDHLPDSLEKIIARKNHLREISVLPSSLLYLDGSNNSIGPVCDLSSLEHIDLSRNFLIEAPVLSDKAQCVNLGDNLIRDFSAEGLSPDCQLFLDGNCLTQASLISAGALHTLPRYPGMSWKAREKWYVILGGGEQRQLDQFQRFLNRLSGVLQMEPEDFQRGVCLWLERLADSAALRKETFALAVEGLAQCYDRALLAFKEMQTAMVRDDVRQGAYDDNLPKLLTVGRQLLRFEQLNNFSLELAFSRRIDDWVEIELYFHVKLRERLGLNTGVQAMYFAHYSGVDGEDADDAERRVKCVENKRFSSWLLDWQAWDDVIERVDPDLFNEAEDERQTRLALWQKESKQAIDAERKKANDVDVLLETSEMADKFTREARNKRNLEFAARHGFIEEMRPLWHPESLKPMRKLIKTEQQQLLQKMGTRF